MIPKSITAVQNPLEPMPDRTETKRPCECKMMDKALKSIV